MKHISFLLNLLLMVAITAVFFHRAQSQGGELTPPKAVSAPTSLLFSYQGQLLDAGGNPITDSAVPMTFKLYSTATGGTACWTEERNGANAVEVENGRFSLLLGQITAIPNTCLTADAYLELTVNGETLSPRERLTSVPYAVEAGTITANAATRGNLYVNGKIFTIAGAELGLQANGGGRLILTNNPGDNKIFMEAFSSDGTTSASEFIITGYLSNALPLITLDADLTSVIGSVSINGNNLYFNNTDPGNVILRQDGSRTLHLLPWAGNGYNFDTVCIGCGSTADLQVQGNLSISGSCSVSSTIDEQGNEVATANTCTGGSITSGAYIEANLQTPEELASKSITRFSQGDLLCWSAESQRLERCTTANDRLVQAVASINGKPIVLGAEPINVLGPVVAGDILVSSDTPGYAMVNNNPLPGTVIGQALEDFNGESGLIKAMIRKW